MLKCGNSSKGTRRIYYSYRLRGESEICAFSAGEFFISMCDSFLLFQFFCAIFDTYGRKSFASFAFFLLYDSIYFKFCRDSLNVFVFTEAF